MSGVWWTLLGDQVAALLPGPGEDGAEPVVVTVVADPRVVDAVRQLAQRRAELRAGGVGGFRPVELVADVDGDPRQA